MTDAWGRLHVEVLEDEIIITLPFTNYTDCGASEPARYIGPLG
jgi:hypothetical protein